MALMIVIISSKLLFSYQSFTCKTHTQLSQSLSSLAPHWSAESCIKIIFLFFCNWKECCYIITSVLRFLNISMLSYFLQNIEQYHLLVLVHTSKQGKTTQTFLPDFNCTELFSFSTNMLGWKNFPFICRDHRPQINFLLKLWGHESTKTWSSKCMS